MENIVILICCVLFIVLLLYSILKSMEYKQSLATWKEISKTQDELIGELKEETNLYKQQMVLYKELCKTNVIYIDVQKQYITELLEILKIEKP